MDVNVSLINDLVKRMQELEKERKNFIYDYISRYGFVRFGIEISDEMADRIRGWAMEAYYESEIYKEFTKTERSLRDVLKLSGFSDDCIRALCNVKPLIEYVPYHINPEKDWA